MENGSQGERKEGAGREGGRRGGRDSRGGGIDQNQSRIFKHQVNIACNTSFHELKLQVMRRLEELEVREALEEQWGEEEETEEETDDEEEESEESDDEEEEEELLSEMRQYSGGERTAEKNRRVSWAFGEGEDPSLPPVNPRLELRFSHSEQPSAKASPLVGEQLPAQPSDLAHFTCQAPKPILKPSTAPILIKEVENSEDADDDEIPEPFEDPCSATVLEKAPTEDVVEEDSELKEEEEEKEMPKRVSKFKAMRAGRK